MSSKLSKVVITGHCGFIGSHVYNHYRYQCCKVVGVDLQDENPVDIRDFKKLAEVCQGADLIIHLAAISSYTACEVNPHEAITTNVHGTRNVFEVAALNKSKVIFASSAAVYGDQDCPTPEYFTTAPQGVYASTKLQGELIANEFLGRGVQSIVCRFFNVYGSNANSQYAGVITKFLNAAAENRPLEIYGSGNQQRDFIHVDDVVSIINSLYMRMYAPKWPLKVNVGTGQGTSINALARVIIGLSRSQSFSLYKPSIAGGVEFSVADIKQLQLQSTIMPRNLIMGLETLL